NIPAVPTFAIFEYFMNESEAGAKRERPMLEYKIKEFKRQLAAGIPFAVGSDVGPFPHGTQAREFELMVKYGMKPLAVLQADMINGAKLLGWQGQIGELKPGSRTDTIPATQSGMGILSYHKYYELIDRANAAYLKTACSLGNYLVTEALTP